MVKKRILKIIAISLISSAIIIGIVDLISNQKTTIKNPKSTVISKQLAPPAHYNAPPAPSQAPQETPPVSIVAPITTSQLPAKIVKLPSQILDLKNWRLTIPVDNDNSGSADQVDQPQLASFRNDSYFKANDTGDAVLFTAYANGATTSNSQYPRSELREMKNNGKDKASWSSTSGRHVMTISEAFVHLPTVKSEVVGAQIHDASDDVIMIRLEKQHLFVEASGKNIGDLDLNYTLGTMFESQIVAENGHIIVSYNGVPTVDYTKSSSGLYFKAGCYTQTNTSRGDNNDSYGQVAIYKISFNHT